MTSNGRTICGRPDVNSFNVYSTDPSLNQISTGIPEYGYIMKDCVSSSNGQKCNTLSNGCRSTIASSPKTSKAYSCNGFVNNTESIGDVAACALSGKSCIYNAITSLGPPSDRFVCTSMWDAITQYRPGCCGGLHTSPQYCDPWSCPLNTNSINECQTLMSDFCTPSRWTNNNVTVSCNSVPPGGYQVECKPNNNNPDDIIDGELACDNFVLSNNDNATSKALIAGALETFYSNGTPLNLRNDPFTQKVIQYCGQFPGACDDILTNACASYTIDDLDPSQYEGGTNDEYGTNLLNTCGCFLQPSSYVNNGVAISKSCNAICKYPNTIPPVDPNTGQFEQCSDNVCYIDGISINLLNSNVGKITLSQLCPPTVYGKKSECYVGDVDINSINSTYAGGEIINDCSACYYTNPSNPTDPTPFVCNCPQGGCTTPPPPDNGGGGGGVIVDSEKVWDKIKNWVSSHKTISIIIGVVIVTLLLIIIMFSMWN